MACGVKTQCNLACGLAGAVRHVILAASGAGVVFWSRVFADMWLDPESAVDLEGGCWCCQHSFQGLSRWCPVVRLMEHVQNEQGYWSSLSWDMHEAGANYFLIQSETIQWRKWFILTVLINLVSRLCKQLLLAQTVLINPPYATRPAPKNTQAKIAMSWWTKWSIYLLTDIFIRSCWWRQKCVYFTLLCKNDSDCIIQCFGIYCKFICW